MKENGERKDNETRRHHETTRNIYDGEISTQTIKKNHKHN